MNHVIARNRPPKFAPISVTLTLRSQAELDAFTVVVSNEDVFSQELYEELVEEHGAGA